MLRPTIVFSGMLTLVLGVSSGPMPALAQPTTQVLVDRGLPHGDFGAPARIVSLREDRALGATIVIFSSGARLIVKRTHHSPGQVSVLASFGAGRAGVPERLVHALWATTLFPLGGTAHLSYADIDAWQKESGHPVNVTLVPAASAFRLEGNVPSGELNAELELLAAYAHEPGFRGDLAAKITNVAPMLATQIEADPAARFTRDVQHRLVGARYQELPEQEDLSATTGTEMPEILALSFAMAPEIAIVGDIEVEAAVREVAATLAAGAPRSVQHGRLPKVAASPSGPPSGPTAPTEKPDTMRSGIYWRLPDFRAKPSTLRVARVAAALIEARLARIGSFGSDPASPPVAKAIVPIDLIGGGFLGIVVETRGGTTTNARDTVGGLLRDLGLGQFTDDELERARQTVDAEHGAEVEDEAWWAQRLGAALRDRQVAQALAADVSVVVVDRGAVAAFVRGYLRGVAPVAVVAEKIEVNTDKGGLK